MDKYSPGVEFSNPGSGESPTLAQETTSRSLAPGYMAPVLAEIAIDFPDDTPESE